MSQDAEELRRYAGAAKTLFAMRREPPQKTTILGASPIPEHLQEVSLIDELVADERIVFVGAGDRGERYQLID